MNVEPVRAALMIQIVQTVAFRQEVFESSTDGVKSNSNWSIVADKVASGGSPCLRLSYSMVPARSLTVIAAE
jgi:hypothetical protein